MADALTDDSVRAAAWRRPREGILGWLALRAAVVAVLAFILAPVVFVSWVSFFRNEIIAFPPEGYTLHWFTNAWERSEFSQGFATSLEVALLAMVAGVALGAPAALALTRSRFPGREWINMLLLSPLVVPGVVLGTGLYVYYVQIELYAQQSFDADVPLLASLPGFVLAHVLITIPWSVRLISASLAGLDPQLEEAAMNLSANRLQTFWWVTLPVVRPDIVAAALFCFIVSFSNLEMTLFLVGPGRTTLPIAILQYLEWKFDPTIAAVSFVQIVVIGVLMVVADRFVRLSKVF